MEEDSPAVVENNGPAEPKTPAPETYSLTDIAIILDMPVQKVLEWLLEGRLFVNPAGPGISLRLSDPAPTEVPGS